MNREACWYGLMAKYEVADQVNLRGSFELTSQMIKDAVNAETRLMCSMNTGKEVPKILDILGLSCLPTSNGVFKISRANAMVRVPLLLFAKPYPLRRTEDCLTLEGPLWPKNESDLLAIARESNILSDAFGETVGSNLGGKKRGWFNFILEGELFVIEGVQIETDGYYETSNAVHVIEVKKGNPEFVSVRQILYSKRLAETIMRGRKPVHSWLMTFSKGTSYFDLHYFEEKNNTYSFNEKMSKRYVLKEKEGLKCSSMIR